MDREKSLLCKNKYNQFNDINFSEFWLAARSGWWFIVGLVLSSVALSLVYDSIRSPLYEARATIRVGWVPLGSSTLPIEPIKDLVAMAKDERVLLPLFKELGFLDHDNRMSQLRNGLTVSVKSPGSSLVEFKLVSSSQDNVRIWLEKLISMKISEHSKVLDDFVNYYSGIPDCIKCNGLAKKAREEKFSLTPRSGSEFLGAYPVEPLVGRTIVSESVKVGVARNFPSLQFLIISSVIGGVLFGGMISFVFLNIRELLRVD